MYKSTMRDPKIFTNKELVGEIAHYEWRIGQANRSLSKLTDTRASLRPANSHDDKYRFHMQNMGDVQVRLVNLISNLSLYKGNLLRLKAEVALRGLTV